MKKIVSILLFFIWTNAIGQINLSPYELTLISDQAFAPAQKEMDQIKLSFHAQEWPLEVLKYVLIRMRQNPFIAEEIFINVTLINTTKTRSTSIKVPVSAFYIEAFKTEEGFNKHYFDFLNDTYEWMLEHL